MLWGGAVGGQLELRRQDGGRVLVAGAFPYNRPAELGRGRVEVIASRAFAARIDAGEDIHLLSGHDFQKPLASRSAGTLRLSDGDDKLTLEADIAGDTTWARDFLAAHAAGLIRGLSPGFRVPKDGERIERRGDRITRTVLTAELIELSAVTRAAYPEAQVEARNWNPRPDRSTNAPRAHWRWR